LPPDSIGDLPPQLIGQEERVLHGVELDPHRRFIDVVCTELAHTGFDEAGDALCFGAFFMAEQ